MLDRLKFVTASDSRVSKFLVRLYGEYNTSLALWKHHVNLLLQIKLSIRKLDRIFISANNATYLNSHV